MNWGASAAVADPSRLVYVLYRSLKILENIHYNHLLGTLDEEAWEGMIESEASPERRISTLTLL